MRLEHVTVPEGLSQSTVFASTQDARGFMWFATQDGLNRFDGHHIRTWHHSSTDDNSIAHNEVLVMLADSAGYLWLGYLNGLDRFNPETGQATHFTPRLRAAANAAALENPGDQVISALQEDANGNIWVSSSSGLYRYDPASAEFSRVAMPDTISTFPAISLAGRERIHLAAGHCLYEISDGDSVLQNACLDDPSENLTSLDTDGQILWAGGRQGLYRYDLSEPGFRRFPLTDAGSDKSRYSRVTDILYGDDVIWIGTDSGLRRFDPDAESMEQFQVDFGDPDGLVSQTINDLFRSRDGVVWIGHDLGVSRFSPRVAGFGHQFTRAQSGKFGADNIVSAILQAKDGNIWVGTAHHGIFIQDPDTGALRHLQHEPGNPDSLGDDRVLALLEDFSGRIWIGTGKGISVWQPEGQGFHHITFAPATGEGAAQNRVFALYEDHAGGILAGTQTGAWRLEEPDSGNLAGSRFVPLEGLPESFLDSLLAVETIYEDLRGNLWLGGSAGLAVRPSGSEIFEHYRHDPERETSLSDNEINAIYEDYDGSLWVGTTAGLNRAWQPEQGGPYRFTRITEADGLVDDYICSILGDRLGHLWLATNHGLVRYHPTRNRFEHFFYSDGLQHDEFFVNSAYDSRDGSLFFGGVNGYNHFQPEQIGNVRGYPDLALTEANASGREIRLPMQKVGQVELEIGIDESLVSLAFSALDYSTPEIIEYRYLITPLMDQWLAMGPRRTMTLAALAPGSYRIDVQARHKGNDWPQESFKVFLRKQGGFWQQTMPWLLLGVTLVLLLTLALWLWRRNLVLRNHTLREQLQAERKVRVRLEDARQEIELEQVKLEDELRDRDFEISGLRREMDEQSYLDAVTGLRTRETILQGLEQQCRHLLESWQGKTGGDREFLSFLMIDIDDFSFINEHHGMVAGDHVLHQVAETLRSACFGEDVLVRWQGQRFLVVAQMRDLQHQTFLAERIRNFISARKFDLGNGSKIDITCSGGFSSYPFVKNAPAALDWEQAMDLAEQALSIAKNNSRNAWLGIRANEATPVAELPAKLAFELGTLVSKGEVDAVTSIPQSKDINWSL